MSVGIKLSHSDNSPVYYAGQSIEGRVVVNYPSKKNIRGIKLKIKGREHTSWGVSEHDCQSSSNNFMSQLITLREEGNIQGTHEYPFNYLLPKNCPSTYRGENGGIEYYFKAVVEMPWAPDNESKLPFVVVSPINFNEHSGLNLHPVKYEEEENLCFFCCAQGPITMTLNMDKEAFILGENISMIVDIKNMTNEKVGLLVVKLETIVKENSSGSGYKKYTYLITKLSDTGVEAYSNRTYNLNLLIPKEREIDFHFLERAVPGDLKVPNFDMCILFEKKHILTVKAKMEGCYRNLLIDTAITLGHIPKSGQEGIGNENMERQC